MFLRYLSRYLERGPTLRVLPDELTRVSCSFLRAGSLFIVFGVEYSQLSGYDSLPGFMPSTVASHLCVENKS